MSYARQRRRFEIIRLSPSVFVWELKGSNQVVMARSPRTYNSEANARRAVKSTRRTASLAAVIIVDVEGKVLSY